MRQRRRFDPEFKAAVVFELLRGEKSAAQLCREHSIGYDQLNQWRKVVVERTPELFQTSTQQSQDAPRVAELERLVGQQALELAQLKKATLWAASPSRSNGR